MLQRSRFTLTLALALCAIVLGAGASRVAAITSPSIFIGEGSGGVAAAISAFGGAIGGANNGGNPAVPAGTGFRTINWDGVKLDATDFGGNVEVIVNGKVVGIPVNRFASRGTTFAEVYAVSGDGFASVNPSAAGHFPAFSPANTFAMFNENTIELTFNVANDSLTPAAVRGFGAVFIDVQLPNTSSIEYFNGTTSLGKFFLDAVPAGQPSFFGALFASAQVTHVELTLGTATLFNVNGSTVTSGPAENLGSGVDLAVTDDFIYSEPVKDLTAPCVASDSILCIDDQPGDARFRVSMTFATTEGGGHSGVGNAIPLTSLGVHRGGLFWLFSADNPEVLVKVLNACPINHKFWVFTSAGTNVGFALRVLDTHTGAFKDYTNADIHAALPAQDTSAFNCP